MMKQNATVKFTSGVRIILGNFIQIVEYKVDDREEQNPQTREAFKQQRLG